MKFDVYYCKKPDADYEDLCRYPNRCENPKIAALTWTQVQNALDSYGCKMTTLDSEEYLVDFLFSLHGNDCNETMRECPFTTEIYPHLEADTLALNIETHEIRRVRRVERNKVSLYNTDDLETSEQKWGYVRIITEEWDRKITIPVNMSLLKGEIGSFYYGSPLGKHPEYSRIAYEDLCGD